MHIDVYFIRIPYPRITRMSTIKLNKTTRLKSRDYTYQGIARGKYVNRRIKIILRFLRNFFPYVVLPVVESREKIIGTCDHFEISP